MKTIVLVLVTSLILPFTGICAGRESGGSDPSNARRENIQKMISEDLKPLLFSFVDNYSPGKITSPVVDRNFRYMIQNGLKADISNSQYSTDGNCLVDNVKKPASTSIGKLGQPICFDAQALSSQNITIRELVALAFHEHSHHFGFDEVQALELEVHISSKYREPAQNNTWSCSAICYITETYKYIDFIKSSNRISMNASAATPAEALTQMNSKCEEIGQAQKAKTVHRIQTNLRATDRWQVADIHSCVRD